MESLTQSFAREEASSGNKLKKKRSSSATNVNKKSAKKLKKGQSTNQPSPSITPVKVQRKKQVQPAIDTIDTAGLNEEEARKLTWSHIACNQIPKLNKVLLSTTTIKLSNAKKLANAAAVAVRRQYNRLSGRPLTAARRSMKEMLMFWRRNEREERDLRKRAEKEAQERRRLEEEQREARRQAKKLNFLITQTELYSHFVGKKGAVASNNNTSTSLAKGTDFADVDDEALQREAERLAANAAAAHQARLSQFDAHKEEKEKEMDFMNPTTLQDAQLLEQPSLLQVQLKSYQLKGLTWLASLYEQVITSLYKGFLFYLFRVLMAFWQMKWVWVRRFNRFPCWLTWRSDKTTGVPS